MSSKREYRRAARYMDDFFAPIFSNKIKSTLELRAAQERIVHFITSTDKNVAFAFATSLGKTVIDVLLIDVMLLHGFDKFLIVTPSVELTHQIKSDLCYFLEFAENEIVRMGAMSVKERKEIWQRNDISVYISTPQNISNDLRSGLLSPDFFQVIIFDEAHRAVGNYAYCLIAEQCYKYAKIIAQTATPGSVVERNESAKALHIDRGWHTVPVEEQLKWQLPIERVIINLEFDHYWRYVWNMLERASAGYYTELYNILMPFGLHESLKKNFSYLKQSDIQELIKLINNLGSSDNLEFRKAQHAFAKLQKMMTFSRYLFEESLELAIIYYKGLKVDGTKAGSVVFKDNFALVKEMADRFQWDKVKKKAGVWHPKIKALFSILEQCQNEQIIIFQNYVKSIEILQKNYLLPWGLVSNFLVGRGHSKMQSVKERNKVRKDFRDGKFQILQASQVGQEGLHFPLLNKEIFLSIPQTGFSQFQAEGRIGRTKLGDQAFYILFSNFDRQRYFANRAKIAKMFADIKKIPDIYVSNSRKVRNINLNRFKKNLMAKELVHMEGKIIRERFIVKGVDVRSIGRQRKITLTLQDKTGQVNAILYVKEENYLQNHFNDLTGQVVLVSGQVRVEDFGEGVKIVNIMVHPDQKQDIVVCAEKDYDKDDFNLQTTAR